MWQDDKMRCEGAAVDQVLEPVVSGHPVVRRSWFDPMHYMLKCESLKKNHKITSDVLLDCLFVTGLASVNRNPSSADDSP